MPIPDFIVALRERVGTAALWLPAVAAVVVRPGSDGDEVLLVRRADTGAWTPVTGILDPGEEPAVGAEREILEETGVVAVADRLVWAHATPEIEFENGDRSTFLSLCFRCSWVSGEPYAADDESSDSRWFDAGALPELEPDQRRRVDLALANGPEAVFAR
ncbi:MAG: NUDIX domain-containing protein [Actinomycetota bacterium]|nr:NUDIX domain-containing protein [Actinomycetota bacterium]